jgi:hypothetical protein
MVTEKISNFFNGSNDGMIEDDKKEPEEGILNKWRGWAP